MADTDGGTLEFGNLNQPSELPGDCFPRWIVVEKDVTSGIGNAVFLCDVLGNAFD